MGLIEETPNPKFLASQLFLLAAMVEIGAPKLSRSKPGKVLLSKCSPAFQQHGTRPDLPSWVTLRLRRVLQLKEDRWEANPSDTPRRQTSSSKSPKLDRRRDYWNPRREVESFLSIIALLANFATFEDWSGQVLENVQVSDIYTRILRLLSQNHFGEAEKGEFLQYSSMLFENTMLTSPRGAQEVTRLLTSLSVDHFAARFLQNLNHLDTALRKGSSYWLKLLAGVADPAPALLIVTKLLELQEERKMHGAAVRSLLRMARGQTTAHLLLSLPFSRVLSALAVVLNIVSQDPLADNQKTNPIVSHVVQLLALLLRLADERPAGIDESWLHADPWQELQVSSVTALFFAAESSHRAFELDIEELDEDDDGGVEGLSKQEFDAWVELITHLFGRSTNHALEFLDELLQRKDEITGEEASSLVEQSLKVVTSFLSHHLVQLFHDQPERLSLLINTCSGKLEFLGQTAKLDPTGTLANIMAHLQALEPIFVTVTNDFFYETLKVFRASLTPTSSLVELRVFHEFSRLWSLEERLRLLSEKIQPFREVDQAWETTYSDVDLDNLLSSSRKVITGSLVKTISKEKPLRVRYISSAGGLQQGQDDGGLCRDWFHRLSEELSYPSLKLLKPQDEAFSGLYQLETGQLGSGPAHLRENLLLLGRLLGLSVVLNIPLSLDFIPPVYKSLVREEVVLQDLAFIDSALCRSLKVLEDLSKGDEAAFAAAAHSLTFTRPGQVEEQPLTQGNFAEFKALTLQEKLVGPFQERMDVVLAGLGEYLFLNDLALLRAEELRGMVSSGGANALNLGEWKKLTLYEDLAPDSTVVVWFWEILDQADEAFRSKVFQWLTGSPRFPVGGFKNRPYPSIAPSKTSPFHLPSVSTCLCRLFLPEYPSKEILKDKLEKAILESNFGVC